MIGTRPGRPKTPSSHAKGIGPRMNAPSCLGIRPRPRLEVGRDPTTSDTVACDPGVSRKASSPISSTTLLPIFTIRDINTKRLIMRLGRSAMGGRGGRPPMAEVGRPWVAGVWSDKVGQNLIHSAPHFRSTFIRVPPRIHHHIGVGPEYKPV